MTIPSLSADPRPAGTVNLALDSPDLAATYDRTSDPQFKHGLALIEPLSIAPGERVLDLGAGTGRLAAHVADLVGPSGNVTAVDPLPLRIEHARAKGRGNIEALVGRAEDLSRFA
ncbi:class I SAM-dependent methyltransferase, partial [Rhodoplanes sp. SY1]|uniref:class I SAM-dependent methyltransferase n=1 Tax=Rhodoplanes sp. SY1 TaxID=3166646 RepID=UPI0038B4AA8B